MIFLQKHNYEKKFLNLLTQKIIQFCSPQLLPFLNTHCTLLHLEKVATAVLKSRDLLVTIGIHLHTELYKHLQLRSQAPTNSTSIINLSLTVCYLVFNRGAPIVRDPAKASHFSCNITIWWPLCHFNMKTSHETKHMAQTKQF